MPDIQLEFPAQGPPGIPGIPGTDGADGEPGPRGEIAALRWAYAVYDPAGPIPGQMMVGVSLTTPLVVLEQHELTGVVVRNWLAALGASTNPTPMKGHLMLMNVQDPTQWIQCQIIDSSVEYIVGKWRVPVTIIAQTVTDFPVGAKIAVDWARVGDKGYDGTGGDMFGANNLTELTDKPGAYNRIKQLGTFNFAGASYFPRGYLQGLITSHATVDVVHDITIAPGQCADSTNAAMLAITATLTKRIDAAWVIGDNNGGLDTGAVTNNTWYYLFLIRRPDTGVVDACFTLSNTTPNTSGAIPAAYTQWRRIASVRYATAAMQKYRQFGDRFMWDDQVSEMSTTFGSSVVSPQPCAGVPRLLNPPIGIFQIMMTSNPSESNLVLICDPALTGAPNGWTVYLPNTSSSVLYGCGETQVRVNSSGQVGVYAAIARDLRLLTRGYIDTRGRDL